MGSIPEKISKLITEHADEVRPIQESYDSGQSEGDYWAEVEWPAGSGNYHEVQFYIFFDFNPAEPQTYDYPGSDSSYEVTDVKIANMMDILSKLGGKSLEFLRYAVREFNREHQDAAVTEILQKADDEDTAAEEDDLDRRMDDWRRRYLGESKNPRYRTVNESKQVLNEAGTYSVNVEVDELYWPPETEGEYGVPTYTATIEADVSVGQSYPGDRTNPPEGSESEVRDARVVGITRSDHDMEGNLISVEELQNWPEGLEKLALNNFYKYNQEAAGEKAADADAQPHNPY